MSKLTKLQKDVLSNCFSIMWYTFLIMLDVLFLVGAFSATLHLLKEKDKEPQPIIFKTRPWYDPEEPDSSDEKEESKHGSDRLS